jgi:hypothetical protein
MAELRVKDIMDHLTGIVVIIDGEERVIVGGPPSTLWTCSPSEYGTDSIRVVPHALTTNEILDLRVARRL